MIYFPKPSNEDDYLKGIIRSSKVITRATSNYNNEKTGYTDIAIIRNKYDVHWHSADDGTYQQYVQIIFPYDKIEIESYLFSPGGNGIYFTNTYTFNCTKDGKEWYILDTHDHDTKITHSLQKTIFDVKQRKKCSIFNFHITGPDSQNSNYGYLGPVEFYGKKYPIILNCPSQNHNSLYFFIRNNFCFVLLICKI